MLAVRPAQSAEKRPEKLARRAGSAKRSRFGEFWKYRAGDCRLIRQIEDDRVIVPVPRLGRRKALNR